jgi:hypothetical protein
MQPGTRIGRRRGGTGEVWEARLVGPQEFRHAVAVKLVPDGGSEEALAPRPVYTTDPRLNENMSCGWSNAPSIRSSSACQP